MKKTICDICPHGSSALQCATKDGCEINDRYVALVDRIATLEQQLNDEKGICEALRSQNSDAVEEVQKLEQQIQQAEKRGYELGYYACEMDDYKEREENTTYEQAVQERDGGAK